MTALTVFAIFFGLLGFSAWSVLRWLRGIGQRGRELVLLAEEGIPALGRVIDVRPLRKMNRGSDYVLTYRFEDAMGAQYDRSIRGIGKRFSRARPGDEIEVVYLPGDPAVSSFADLVLEVQEAQARTPVTE